jgi:hypothetical protein
MLIDLVMCSCYYSVPDNLLMLLKIHADCSISC